MDGFPTQAFANGAGVVTVVLFVGWLLYKGVLVFGRELADVRSDRDRWRMAAEASAEQVKKMLSEEQTSATVLRSIESYIRGQR